MICPCGSSCLQLIYWSTTYQIHPCWPHQHPKTRKTKMMTNRAVKTTFLIYVLCMLDCRDKIFLLQNTRFLEKLLRSTLARLLLELVVPVRQAKFLIHQFLRVRKLRTWPPAGRKYFFFLWEDMTTQQSLSMEHTHACWECFAIRSCHGRQGHSQRISRNATGWEAQQRSGTWWRNPLSLQTTARHFRAQDCLGSSNSQADVCL